MQELFDEAARPDLRPIGDFIRWDARFDDATADALRTALRDVDTIPQTIAAADRAQQQIIDVLLAHEHPSAAFLEVYHGITVAVIAALEAGELSPKPFFVRLAGRFAERHFDGLKVELGIPTTTDAATYGLWRPSFAFDNLERGDSVLGMKPALAHFTVGMCCHINFDLAVALDMTIRELGFERDKAALESIERGHNFVDTILEKKVEGSTELLATRLGCPVSKKIVERGVVTPMGVMSMAMIRRWRAKTFTHALQLCTAPGDAEREAIRAEIYRAGARKTVRLFNTLPSMLEGMLHGTWP